MVKTVMNRPTIVFVPSKPNHWEMYTPLCESLQEAGVDTLFATMSGLFKNDTLPRQLENGDRIRLWRPQGKSRNVADDTMKMFFVFYREILPQWHALLTRLGKGAVVVAQDGAALTSALLNAARAHGFKRVGMQDGHFVTLPTAYGWQLQKGYRARVKKLLSRTPLRRFITRGIGASTDYFGLYGNMVRTRLCDAGILSEKGACVIGSPRHAVFRQRVAAAACSRPHDEFRILCLPTTFPSWRDDLLVESQNEALRWMLQSALKLGAVSLRPPSITVKVKKGYDHEMRDYRMLLNHPAVNVLDGSVSVENLIADSDLVITTGSTAALEAFMCNRAVVQIMPPYLYRNYIAISGIPLARTYEDVEKYMSEIFSHPRGYVNGDCRKVREELADADPAWDSICRATEWLSEIVRC